MERVRNREAVRGLATGARARAGSADLGVRNANEGDAPASAVLDKSNEGHAPASAVLDKSRPAESKRGGG